MKNLIPVLDWGRRYKAEDLRADTIAGVVVVFITVPQVIAYAFLAGLPPETGLYAAILALLGYAAFGSSKTLAVGPTAILAMMTLEATSSFADPGTTEYAMFAMKLGFVTGMTLIVLRIINFGALINFLSHAVVTGFISAAAILIITNQFPAILGTGSSTDNSMFGIISFLLVSTNKINMVVVAISVSTIALLIYCRGYLESLLLKLGVKDQVASSLVKSAPMYAVVLGIAVTSVLELDIANNVPVVGNIPAHLPVLAWVPITLAEIQVLLPSALLIAMVVFMESTSVGSAMAAKKRQKIEPNQELVGLGMANIGASIAGGFPVAGSFARTVVNFSSGAHTPVASVITALLVIVTLVWFAPLFYYLPKGVLSAIIVISAWQLIDARVIRRIFAFNVTDAATFSCTFIAVLVLGVESGILVGIIISFVLLIRSSSRPDIIVVGRVGDTEHFRNVERFEVTTAPEVLALRVDQSVYFVNTRFIENFIISNVADSPEVKHVLLICTATNFIDTSGLEMLEHLCDNLNEVGVTLHLAEVKSAIMDKLNKTDFCDHMRGEIYFTTDIAMKDLAGV
ncbi:MAG: sulfate permease [Gammaproteobacteria bacterium]|nr:sulfate permease [Gammaproteobacteria bacterium]